LFGALFNWMKPTLKKEILDLPRVLRETLDKGRKDYDAVLRRTPWDEIPITFVGSEQSLPLAEYMAGGFESLLEWPCVVRTASEVVGDPGAKVRPKNIYFLISEGNEPSELVNVALAVRARKGFALALVVTKEDSLVQAVDGTFVVRSGGALGNIHLSICAQTVAGYIALMAARALKRPRPRFDALEKEFGELPSHLEWAFSQHGEGVRSLATGLARARNLTLVAGGSYHFAAVSAAALLSQFAGIAARVRRVADVPATPEAPFEQDSAILVLTGARSRMKKQTHAVVKAARRAGAKVFSLTDGNDPEISRHSAMTLLLPPLDEITGATLAHAVLAWTTYEASRQSLVGRNLAK